LAQEGLGRRAVLLKKMPSMEEMMEALRGTALFEKLLAEGPNIEKDFYSFRAKYAELWSGHDPPIVVLRSHLIIEYFLDRYLPAANPGIEQWGKKLGLSSFQKLALADNSWTFMHYAMPALRCLNRLRNDVAHDLSVSLDESAVKPIHEFVALWSKARGEPIPEGTELIEHFARRVCGVLDAMTSMIKRHGHGHGLTGLLEWYGMEDKEA